MCKVTSIRENDKRCTMVKKIKVDQPKIPAYLEKANFQDIYYEEDPELVNCEVDGAVVDNEVMDRVFFSKVHFKNTTFINSSFNKIDSAVTVIDPLSFTGSFKFFNAPAGTYYIVIKGKLDLL